MKTRLEEIRETLEKFSDSWNIEKLGISPDNPVFSSPGIKDKIKVAVDEFNTKIPPLYHELGSISGAIDLRKKCKNLEYRIRSLAFMYKETSGDENGISKVTIL